MKAIGQSKEKLKNNMEGPFKVVAIHNEGRSIEIAGANNVTWRRHISDLAPCRD
jgi:hypothetical protein